MIVAGLWRLYLLVWLTLTVWRAIQPDEFEKWAEARTLNKEQTCQAIT